MNKKLLDLLKESALKEELHSRKKTDWHTIGIDYSTDNEYEKKYRQAELDVKLEEEYQLEQEVKEANKRLRRKRKQLDTIAEKEQKILRQAIHKAFEKLPDEIKTKHSEVASLKATLEALEIKSKALTKQLLVTELELSDQEAKAKRTEESIEQLSFENGEFLDLVQEEINSQQENERKLQRDAEIETEKAQTNLDKTQKSLAPFAKEKEARELDFREKSKPKPKSKRHESKEMTGTEINAIMQMVMKSKNFPSDRQYMEMVLDQLDRALKYD